jgi:hypothetical protein
MRLPDAGRSQAILIGVADYADSAGLPALTAARNNVHRMADLLRDPRLWGLPDQRCRLILDPVCDSEPALAIARSAQEPNETLLVYFAGHGLVAPSGELVLATSATMANLPHFSGLRYSWVREALATARARRTIVIVDCCFSGRAIHAMSAASSLLAGQLDVRGAYVLTSTSATMVAAAPAGSQYTAFTGSVIDLLSNGLTDGGAYLCLNDLYEWTRKDMVRQGHEQPLQMGTNQVGALPFLRNIAAARGEESRESRTAPAVAAHGDELGDTSLVLEISGYDAMKPLAQVDAHLLTIQIVDASARAAGFDLGSWIRRPLRNGELVVMPHGSTDLDALAALVRTLGRAVRDANVARPIRDRLTVNVILTSGEDGIDSNAIVRRHTATPFANLGADPRTGHDDGLVAVITGNLARVARQRSSLMGTLRPLATDGDGTSTYVWTP